MGRLDDVPRSADIVIAGAGMAGFCAALEAAAAGADVLLLEKEASVGGSSLLSGGSFAFAGTDRQREAGIEDGDALFFDDLRRVGDFSNEERLVRSFVERQLDTYAWLVAKGFAFGPPVSASGQSVPRTHHTDPRAMFDRLRDAADATGRIHLATDVAAVRLLRPPGHDRVEGVRVRSGDGEADIQARAGVLLATGGFMRSEALLANFAPSQAAALRMGGRGCIGDGLRMAWQLGADLRDMGSIKGSFGCHPSERGEDHYMLFPIYKGAIAVNQRGERFADESRSYKWIGEACLKQPGGIGYQIFDQPIMDRSVPDGSSFDFGAELAAGRLLRADTLDGLCALLDVDPAGLSRTLAAYNADGRAGHDRAFGRTSLSSGWHALVPIERPPFYAYPSKSVVVGTYCGLLIDEGCRVLDVFGAPIEGLYAAGHVMGGFHGAAYMTGTTLSKAAVFGRLAGRAMASSSRDAPPS